MDAKQFSWIYMITNGHANVNPSYYGGYDVIDKTVKAKKDRFYENYEQPFLDQIKEIGVNWDKTRPIQSESFSMFAGTFHDPGQKEFLIGELVLNNGYKQHWMAEPYISNVFEMMADIDNFKEKFKEIFWE